MRLIAWGPRSITHRRLRRSVLAFAVALPLCAQNPMTDAVKASYARIRQNLVETAEVVPETGYAFKLTPAQRTFGEWIGHTAATAYTSCAGIQGSAPPAAAHAVHDLIKKDDLTRALRESLEFCDAALNTMDDRKAATEISIGDRKLFPATPMVSLIGSLNEHYGNLVGYMRSQGIVPPSTARAAKKK